MIRKCGTRTADGTRGYFIGHRAENKLQQVIHSSFSSQKNYDIQKIEQFSFLQFWLLSGNGPVSVFMTSYSVWNDVVF
jgi:hypothetical protein